MEKQLRISNFSNMSQEDMILEGYAVTFDSPTVLYTLGGIDYKEVIDKNAFVDCNFKDCCLKYNHNDSVPILARTRGNSLELIVDNKGLFFRAKLFNTQAARDVYTLVKEGALDKCSFSFTINEIDGDSYDPKTKTRTIKKISRLWDCSVVDIPAYDSTSVSARSFFELEKEKEQKALDNAELRKRLILKTYL